MVDVRGAETDAEGFARDGVGGLEGEEESYRVCAAGDGDADAVAGFNVGAVEGECGHRCFIVPRCDEVRQLP